ncbi:MAG TPA: FKBP-type peptidyl-prolyl cis-trans isomerase [Polyangiaceae bacterium]|nr:FKBP-type peptidyl-prolyl cis-trans isomerase [Polyangiaceae bacterium]
MAPVGPAPASMKKSSSIRKWHLALIAPAVVLGAWVGWRAFSRGQPYSTPGGSRQVSALSASSRGAPSPPGALASDGGSIAPDPSAPSDVSAPPGDASVSAAGVAYRVLKSGGGSSNPLPDDRVTVHYTSWKRTGTLVDSSRLRGEPYVQTLRYMVPGLAEAIASMTEGEQRRIWVPARLTFASNDEKPHIPEDLTFEVELLRIRRAPVLPTGLRQAPRTATRTASGLAYEFMKPRGPQGPAILPNTRVTFSHSVWTESGTLFESSEMSEQPVSSSVSTLIPGLREGLPLLRPGDRVRFWIPAALAYGDKPGRHQPGGALIYELELMKIE